MWRLVAKSSTINLSMSTQPNIQKRPLAISPLLEGNKTLLVFGATIAAYAIALLSEIYVLSLYGIGPDMVELSPFTLLNGVIGLVIVYVIFEVWTEIYYQLIASSKRLKDGAKIWLRLLNDTSQAAFLLLTIYGIIILQLVYSTNDLSSINKYIGFWTIPLGMFVLTAFVVLSPLVFNIFRKERLSLTQALKNHYEKNDAQAKKIAAQKKNTQNMFIGFTESTIIKMIVICLILFTIPINFASVHTKIAQNYYVIDSKENVKTLIVRHYPNTILAKEYDTKNHKFLDGFQVIKIDNNISLKETYQVPAWKSNLK